MLKRKQIRYIIEYHEEITKYPYNFYESYEEAERKRLYISKNEGRILKVTIEETKGD